MPSQPPQDPASRLLAMAAELRNGRTRGPRALVAAALARLIVALVDLLISLRDRPVGASAAPKVENLPPGPQAEAAASRPIQRHQNPVPQARPLTRQQKRARSGQSFRRNPNRAAAQTRQARHRAIRRNLRCPRAGTAPPRNRPDSKIAPRARI